MQVGDALVIGWKSTVELLTCDLIIKLASQNLEPRSSGECLTSTKTSGSSNASIGSQAFTLPSTVRQNCLLAPAGQARHESSL